MVEGPIRLTEHFTRKELECRCCGLFTMSPEFVFFLERVRKDVDEPMIIESGQRCVRRNSSPKVKGAPDSPHLTGLAVDVTCDNDRLRMKLVAAGIRHGATGVGVYEGHVHLDKKVREKEALWWGTY